VMRRVAVGKVSKIRSFSITQASTSFQGDSVPLYPAGFSSEDEIVLIFQGGIAPFASPTGDGVGRPQPPPKVLRIG
jgi:hypothetical protein